MNRMGSLAGLLFGGQPEPLLFMGLGNGPLFRESGGEPGLFDDLLKPLRPRITVGNSNVVVCKGRILVRVRLRSILEI